MLAAVGLLRHVHGHQLLLRVDPEVGASVAGPEELAYRTWPGRLADVTADREAQAEAVAVAGDPVRAALDARTQHVIRRHEGNGPRPENAHAVELAAVGEHLRKAQVVARGRSEAVPAREERGRLRHV